MPESAITSSRQTTFLVIILLTATLVRLVHLDFPVGGYQAWRQADTAAMARNYYEQGFHFFSPQIDWGGNTDGRVESEFPLYQYVVALLYGVFGFHEWFGRALSILCSLLTILGAYAVVRQTSGERAALFASAFLAFAPTSIFYGRTFMPESMMLMFSVWGIYYFLRYSEKGLVRPLVVSALFVALAALLKITALFLGVPLLFLAWRRYGWKLFLSATMWLYAVAVLLPVAGWYYHAHQLYLESGLTFGIWMPGQNKWLMWDPLLSFKFYNDVLFKSIAERHLTYAGFVVFLVGVFVKRKNKSEFLYDWWCAGFGIFLAIVTTGNQIHEYYQLPFLLPASAYVGRAIEWMTAQRTLESSAKAPSAKYAVGLLWVGIVLFPILSAIRTVGYFHDERWDSTIFDLEREVKNKVPQSALVVALDEYDPIVLYRADRKGWHASPSTITSTELLDHQKEGATFLIAERGRFDELPDSVRAKIPIEFPPVVLDSKAVILRLLVFRLAWPDPR